MVCALAFLPPTIIPTAFNEWQQLIAEPDEKTTSFIKYLESNYVLGPLHNNRRGPVPFPPFLWSVADRTELGLPRTQNAAESWNNRWKNLLDRSHGVYAT